MKIGQVKTILFELMWAKPNIWFDDEKNLEIYF